jgi:transcriptional regulator
MLIRPHDAPIDSEREWRDLVTAHPFGHLIAPGTARALPVVVPTHIHFDGDVTIRLHLARPNPVWSALRENPQCLFVVTAAVAYVPTSWEAPPGTPAECPTSHYASVHLECTATVTDEPDHIRRYLADQLATLQRDEPFGDPLDTAIPYEDKLRQIRGLQLAITDVHAKFKFDGAEPDSVRQQVIDGYQRRNAPGDAEALAHLRRRHHPAATTEQPST